VLLEDDADDVLLDETDDVLLVDADDVLLDEMLLLVEELDVLLLELEMLDKLLDVDDDDDSDEIECDDALDRLLLLDCDDRLEELLVDVLLLDAVDSSLSSWRPTTAMMYSTAPSLAVSVIFLTCWLLSKPLSAGAHLSKMPPGGSAPALASLWVPTHDNGELDPGAISSRPTESGSL
jgi:hypothetical protein